MLRKDSEYERQARYSTEQKIRILRAADAGRAIVDVCREAGISEQTFHRWKRELGMLEVDQAKQLKTLNILKAFEAFDRNIVQFR